MFWWLAGQYAPLECRYRTVEGNGVHRRKRKLASGFCLHLNIVGNTTTS